MTDKEKLEAVRAEIHKLVHVNGYSKEMANELFAFINSLPEEPVSEDLEEAASDCYYHNHACAKESFIEGANWQREQMISTAVEAEVTDIRTYKSENEVDFTLMLEKGIIPYEMEEEVKLIIIKGD